MKQILFILDKLAEIHCAEIFLYKRMNRFNLQISALRDFYSISYVLDDALRKYNQNQPRVPAGRREGGQWTSDGNGSSATKPKPKKPEEYYGDDYDFPADELMGDLIAILPINKIGKIRSIRELGKILKSPGARGLEIAKRIADRKWTFGKHKSKIKWENRMVKGGWTKREVTNTIIYGKKYKAENKVNKENTATRYERNGKFVVRDDKTKEILQVSRPDIKPDILK